MEYKISRKLDLLPPSGIRKINEKALQLEREGKNIIHLEIGRPDFDTPEYIKKACIKSIEEGNVFYTSNFGTLELRRAIAEKLEKQNHIKYDPQEEILVSVGLSEAVYNVLSVLLEEGDEILVPDPVWMNYLNLPKLLGAVPVTYQLLEENDYQPDLDEIKKKITDKTKAMVIVSPNNPTGGVLKKQTLEQLAGLAVKHDMMMISDEVYERIIFDGETHLSIASMEGMKDRTVTLNGFSKAYSMTGWRLGYVAAPAPIIAAVNKMHQHLTTCASSFVQAAGVAALREEKDELQLMVAEYKRRRDYLVSELNQIPGFRCRMPGGSFYVYVNVKAFSMSSAELCEYFLMEGHVAAVPGSVFGENGEGYLRLSFANSYENIAEAVERLKKCVAELIKAGKIK